MHFSHNLFKCTPVSSWTGSRQQVQALILVWAPEKPLVPMRSQLGTRNNQECVRWKGAIRESEMKDTAGGWAAPSEAAAHGPVAAPPAGTPGQCWAQLLPGACSPAPPHPPAAGGCAQPCSSVMIPPLTWGRGPTSHGRTASAGSATDPAWHWGLAPWQWGLSCAGQAGRPGSMWFRRAQHSALKQQAWVLHPNPLQEPCAVPPG